MWGEDLIALRSFFVAVALVGALGNHVGSSAKTNERARTISRGFPRMGDWTMFTLSEQVGLDGMLNLIQRILARPQSSGISRKILMPGPGQDTPNWQAVDSIPNLRSSNEL